MIQQASTIAILGNQRWIPEPSLADWRGRPQPQQLGLVPATPEQLAPRSQVLVEPSFEWATRPPLELAVAAHRSHRPQLVGQFGPLQQRATAAPTLGPAAERQAQQLDQRPPALAARPGLAELEQWRALAAIFVLVAPWRRPESAPQAPQPPTRAARRYKAVSKAARQWPPAQDYLIHLQVMFTGLVPPIKEQLVAAEWLERLSVGLIARQVLGQERAQLGFDLRRQPRTLLEYSLLLVLSSFVGSVPLVAVAAVLPRAAERR